MVNRVRGIGRAVWPALVLLLLAGCVPSSPGGGDEDAEPLQARDAEPADADETDLGPLPDIGGPDEDAGPDGALPPDGDVADAVVDAMPDPDAAPDAAPACDEGSTRACPDCEGGQQTCIDGAWGECIGALEACNGIDDDCDGAADEDFPELGEACGIGTGACRGEGTIVCGMMGTRCDARPGRPTNERCDDLDNDCDGSTDEDFDVGDACTVGVGACARDGVVVCHPELANGVCDAELVDPIVEICDGADNDCDGLADEGLNVGQPCAAGEGLCRNEGEIVCTDDGAAVCSVEAGDPAADELCNALDDDCDGVADEGLQVGEACVLGDGECQVPGIIICNAMLAAECEALPDNAERCDGADNDCDGLVDEDFRLGAPCQTGGGVCQAPGTVVCAPDGTEGCAAEAEPVLGVGDGSDGELMVPAGQQVVLENRSYDFTDVTVAAGGTLTVAAYDPAADTGGQLEIRVLGRLLVQANGVIDLSGRGFPGGAANPKVVRVYQGQWTNNGGSTGFHGAGPGAGYGGFAAPQQTVGSGGGGGHAAAGAAGTPCGVDGRNYTCWDPNAEVAVPIAAPGPLFSSGGAAYADPAAGAVTMGSGGGSGGNNYDGGAGGIGGAGGAGGGALLIVAGEVAINGTIRLDGGAGVAGNGGSYLGGGGGGAGGSVYVASPLVTIAAGGRISAAGGLGASGAQGRGIGGAGSAGWVRIDAGQLNDGGQVQPAAFLGQFDCALPE